jgi:hypothetical protein
MDINQANQRLHRVKLRQKGNRLYIRATLPSKAGLGTARYELPTGIPATPHGLKLALAKAQSLESDLLLERFNWDTWGQDQREDKTIGDWLAEFVVWYWNTHDRTPSREKQFKLDYWTYYDPLPKGASLTELALTKILLQYQPSQRGRVHAHRALSKLARFARLELSEEWSTLKGNYQPTNQRKIPTDADILATIERLSGVARWVFGVMSCYGIRNHEIIHASLENYPVLTIGDKTKTGRRIVYPLHKDWPDQFNLQKERRPNIQVQVNRDAGNQIGHLFRHHKIGFTPYSLRDAYAIRGAVLGISPAIMAKWLGHSLDTHYRHYLRWIERKDFDDVWAGL